MPRVSTRDQHPEAQLDALSSVGCKRTFTDQASGTLARRPALDEALSYLRSGADVWQQWPCALGTDDSAAPGPVSARVLEVRTAVWTPTVSATAKEVDQALPRACQQISYAVDYHEHGHVDPCVHTKSLASGLTELLIVDEAHRLKTTGWNRSATTTTGTTWA